MSGLTDFFYRLSLKLLFIILLVFLSSFTKCAQFPAGQVPDRIAILSYNVCNLFDDSDNGTEYPEFDPSGEYWNTSLYLSKLESTGNAVLLSYPPEGPDIIAFQEIENSRVLKDLSSGYLKNMGYKYYTAAEKDNTAITTGFLSRYPISGIKNHAIIIENHKFLRNILECRITTPAGDFLLFNNHWKSKIGGAELTEEARIAAAAVVSARISGILKTSPETDIIVLGDLNENIDEYFRAEEKYTTALYPEITALKPDNRLLYVTDRKGDFQESADPGSRLVLFSPWFEYLETENVNKISGSYYYRNKWETIDHFLLAHTLFDRKNFDYSHFRVIDDAELLDRYHKPLVWNRVTQRGYSDHLPVLLVIENCSQGSK